jgi:hypothetical protein
MHTRALEVAAAESMVWLSSRDCNSDLPWIVLGQRRARRSEILNRTTDPSMLRGFLRGEVNESRKADTTCMHV